MNFSTLWENLKSFFVKMWNRLFKKPTISLLIPFSSNDPLRQRNFKWLLEYWKHELPEAEIVIGHSTSPIFCKGEALNSAARKARGKVFVILDADAYMEGSVLRDASTSILESLQRGYPLWYVPYRNLYRLKQGISDEIVASDPTNPIRLTSPPPKKFVEEEGMKSRYGHRYGAMCMMFPREAYKAIGNFDERFVGWGGEDVALLRMLDTVYGKHKTQERDIHHLWHPTIGDNYDTRRWVGQDSGSVNWPLAKQYSRAMMRPEYMQDIINNSVTHYKQKHKTRFR